MTLEKITTRWDLVGRLAFVVVLCFSAEMLVYVVQMFVALAVGMDDFGSTGLIATVWRWLAWVPALVYAAAVLISIPLPRVRRDTRWSADGNMRVPPIGRGLLLFFGILAFLSVMAHSVSFLPAGVTGPASSYVVYLMLGAIGLLVLRMILGLVRLVPRSWRVAPEPAHATAPGIEVPDQHLAPPRNREKPTP